jgi:pectinesterase
MAGITRAPDTSYSLQSAFRSSLKTNADIQIAAEIISPEIAVQKGIVYCKAGEDALALDVFSPAAKATTQRAAIIIIHGGGWRSGSPSLHYPLAQRLAQLGYVCFTPQYRLSTHALYPAAVHDLKAAVSWVRTNAPRWNLDTNAIAAMGHSAGGELVAFLGATNGMARFDSTACRQAAGSKVNAVVDIDGVLAFIHPESGEGDDSKRTSAATYWFGYSKTENPGLWYDASPLTHAGAHTPPVLFLNSSVARMQAGQKDFIARLQQYGIYSEVHTFEGAPHSFPLFHPWFQPMVDYIHHFLQKVFDGNKP